MKEIKEDTNRWRNKQLLECPKKHILWQNNAPKRMVHILILQSWEYVMLLGMWLCSFSAMEAEHDSLFLSTM